MMNRKAAVQATLSFDNEDSVSQSSLIEPITENSVLGEPEKDKALSVSELGRRIKNAFDCDKFTNITVIGEITEYKSHYTGSLYFSLTEKADSDGGKNSVIKCVMWKYAARYLSFTAKDGLSVRATGNIDFYPPSGRLQFIVKKMEPSVGSTGLYLQKEIWKKQLEEQKIIPRPESEKRNLPIFPKNVGVVTSKTGSVLQDIKNVLSRRYPLPIFLAPSAVQGAGAEKEIVSAIHLLEDKADVIIVARGGGSFDDLFVFNHPDVVKAIRYCKVPVISAIGHETDTTLSDYASDLRVPTPSVAAETVVPDRKNLHDTLENNRRLITDSIKHIFKIQRSTLDELKQRVDPNRLTRRLDDMHQQTAEYEERIRKAFSRRINSESEIVKKLSDEIFKNAADIIYKSSSDLSSLKEIISERDPYKPLEKGYALVFKDGSVIKSKNKIAVSDCLTLKLSDGEVRTKVEEVK